MLSYRKKEIQLFACMGVCVCVRTCVVCVHVRVCTYSSNYLTLRLNHFINKVIHILFINLQNFLTKMHIKDVNIIFIMEETFDIQFLRLKHFKNLYTSYVTRFAKRGPIHTIISIKRYILKYLIHYILKIHRAVCMHFSTNLQSSKTIQCLP